MTARTIMVQGTASNVGKSLLVTALCRIFKQDGYRVAPFKAQNMSLNSYVTADGAEIGRAQVVQAEAAGVLPTAEMNPILLKPEVDSRSQLIVLGRPVGKLESRNFNQRKDTLWDAVTQSLDSLRAQYDIVVIEGAGSPAEINLRRGDIVNMEVALYARSPVLLAGDIDKGGVFASLLGTLMLLAPKERELVCGAVINKFRGDVSILQPGLRQFEALAGVPVLGVVPYFRDIYIHEEDSPSARNTAPRPGAAVDVAVIALPHIANFDEFDPLAREECVSLRYVRSAGDLGSPDLIIIPGTKTTIPDPLHLRTTGIASAILARAREGMPVIGICGGFQMLGRSVHDPGGVESASESADGLGLLPVTTRFVGEKQTHQVTGSVSRATGLLAGLEGVPFEGYEIHMGITSATEAGSLRITRLTGGATYVDGAVCTDGLVIGTYVHGLFQNTALRRGIIRNVAAFRGKTVSFSKDFFRSPASTTSWPPRCAAAWTFRPCVLRWTFNSGGAATVSVAPSTDTARQAYVPIPDLQVSRNSFTVFAPLHNIVSAWPLGRYVCIISYWTQRFVRSYQRGGPLLSDFRDYRIPVDRVPAGGRSNCGDHQQVARREHLCGGHRSPRRFQRSQVSRQGAGISGPDRRHGQGGGRDHGWRRARGIRTLARGPGQRRCTGALEVRIHGLQGRRWPGYAGRGYCGHVPRFRHDKRRGSYARRPGRPAYALFVAHEHRRRLCDTPGTKHRLRRRDDPRSRGRRTRFPCPRPCHRRPPAAAHRRLGRSRDGRWRTRRRAHGHAVTERNAMRRLLRSRGTTHGDAKHP